MGGVLVFPTVISYQVPGTWYQLLHGGLGTQTAVGRYPPASFADTYIATALVAVFFFLIITFTINRWSACLS